MLFAASALLATSLVPSRTAARAPSPLLSARITRTPAPVLSASVDRTFGRCEPWAPERATLLEVVNVVGRFGADCSEWAERTEFAENVDEKDSTEAQAATAKRRAFADKNNQLERVAFRSNVPKLPFTDARLASSVGKSVDDFSQPPSNEHLAIVFDAIANSKASLVSREDADARISLWRTSDGALDADAFGSDLRKGLVSVLAANAVLYFFIFSGVAVLGRVLFDGAQGKF